MFLRSITIQNKKKEAKHQKNKRLEKGAIEKSRKYFDIYEKLHDDL